MWYTIFDDKKNYKASDTKDVESLVDTLVVFECDAEVAEITLQSKMLPFVAQSSTLELKPLPSHLKYVYLERDEKLPIIIFSFLTNE